MNKSELIAQIAKEADISQAAAGRVVDAFTGAVAGALKKGDTVQLIGFGTFKVSKRAARTGRNPRTGAEIKIDVLQSIRDARKQRTGLYRWQGAQGCSELSSVCMGRTKPARDGTHSVGGAIDWRRSRKSPHMCGLFRCRGMRASAGARKRFRVAEPWRGAVSGAWSGSCRCPDRMGHRARWRVSAPHPGRPWRFPDRPSD